MHIQAPFIEQLHIASQEVLSLYDNEAAERIKQRSEISERICQILDSNGPYTISFYGELANIMRVQPRLALYLPFCLLEKAPKDFRYDYLDAWRNCWSYTDIRESFNLGDVFAANARLGKPECVVKAIHLIPWLVKYRYLSEESIIAIIRFMRDDELLCWSAFDAVIVMEQEGLIDKGVSYMIREIMYSMPRHDPPAKKIFETVARERWLKDRKKNYSAGKDFKFGNVTGGFLENIVQAKIPEPRDYECLLVGGPQLKGCGRDSSDIDIIHYDLTTHQLSSLESFSLYPANVAHVILDYAWVGRSERETKIAQTEAASFYVDIDEENRYYAEFVMECDLLQSQLMHKGFPARYPNDCSLETCKYESIDGSSAFYDDRYRTIATKLFVKYVFIP